MSFFLHADLDAFYASVEQLDHPEYRGKPVIVGGLPGDRRSVVSTASYEARKYGVHSAMPIAEAARRCPDGVFLRGNMERYREKSGEVMEVFSGFSPELQQLSIDEAFLDVSGTEGLFGPPEQLSKKLKAQVKQKTGLTVSVGLASNKYIAKIASGMSKPDGCCIIPPGGEEAFMLELPVGKIWGAGSKTQEVFRRHGFKTCRDIHLLPQEKLVSIFGKAYGVFLYRAVRGEGAQAFETERGTRSMSAERTFLNDLYDEFEIETALFDICQTIMFRFLSCPWQSRTVFIKIRYEDFTTVGARETLERPITTLNSLYDRLLSLFRGKYQSGRGVRLIGAGLGNLEEKAPEQGDLFGKTDEKERRLEQSILEINNKFPGAALKRLRSLNSETEKPPGARD
ncbi:MAG: DNA polymerase IV [Treponema sp.]|jgi:DNA polymerase-4|nr:DNA polymerase IV [Treponema sp.]